MKKIDPQPSAFSNGGDGSDDSDNGHTPHFRHLTAAESLAEQVRKDAGIAEINRVDEADEGGDEEGEEEEEPSPSSEQSSIGRKTQHAATDGAGKGYGSMERTPPWNSVLKPQQRPPPAMVIDSPLAPIRTAPSASAPLERLTPSTALLSHLKPANTYAQQASSSYLSPPPHPAPPLPTQLEETDIATPLSPSLPSSPFSSIPRKSPRFFLSTVSTSPRDVSDCPRSPGRRSSSSVSRKPPSSKLVLPSPFLSPPKDSALSPPRRTRVRAMSLKADPANAILGHEAEGGVARAGVLAMMGGSKSRQGSSKESARPPTSLEEILPSLLPQERKFVDALDKNLEKVER